MSDLADSLQVIPEFLYQTEWQASQAVPMGTPTSPSCTVALQHRRSHAAGLAYGGASGLQLGKLASDITILAEAGQTPQAAVTRQAIEFQRCRALVAN